MGLCTCLGLIVIGLAAVSVPAGSATANELLDDPGAGSPDR
jgi:hypothetical protein